jgi:hypothetical protein
MGYANAPLCRFPYGRNLQSSSSALPLDGTSLRRAFILPAPRTGNLVAVHFLLGNTVTGRELLVSLQDVDPATGDPDGVVDQSGLVSVVDTDDFVWKTAVLDNPRAVVRGAPLAVVIEWSGTAGSTNIEAGSALEVGNIYCDRYVSGSWAKSPRSPLVVLEYEGGVTAATGGVLAGGSTAMDFNSGSSPSERALRFSLPFPVRVMGAGFFGRLTGDVDLVLYEGTTELASVSLDKDMKEATTADQDYHGYFAESVELAKETVYRVGVKPTTGTNARIYVTDVSQAGHLDGLPGGQKLHYSSRSGAGAWSDLATRRPIIYLLLEGFAASLAVVMVQASFWVGPVG